MIGMDDGLCTLADQTSYDVLGKAFADMERNKHNTNKPTSKPTRKQPRRRAKKPVTYYYNGKDFAPAAFQPKLPCSTAAVSAAEGSKIAGTNPLQKAVSEESGEQKMARK